MKKSHRVVTARSCLNRHDNDKYEKRGLDCTVLGNGINVCLFYLRSLRLVGVVLPHDSRSLFELAPLTSATIGLRDTQLTEKHSESVLKGDNNKSTSDSNVDSDGEDILVDQTDALQCLSSHPSAWRCGTASHRARALCSTVNRYTDAHFTSLSHQVEHILAARFVAQRKRLRRDQKSVEAELRRITSAISAEKQVLLV